MFKNSTLWKCVIKSPKTLPLNILNLFTIGQIKQHNVLQPKWEDEDLSSSTQPWPLPEESEWLVVSFVSTWSHVHHKTVLQSWLDSATHLLLECPSIFGMRLSFYLTSSVWTSLDYMNDVNPTWLLCVQSLPSLNK
jgi:hypothetical protein